MSRPRRFGALLLAFFAAGCQNSAERARTEMQSVYRSAIALDEQMKGGADLKDLRTLGANLATELTIVHNRMQANPALDHLLRKYYATYQTALQSYSLVIDIVEYHDISERCIAPRHESAGDADRKSMTYEERIADVMAESEFFHRVFKCVHRYSDLDHSLHQRAEQLGMNCPKFEWDSGCLAGFAEAKLKLAQNLLLKR